MCVFTFVLLIFSLLIFNFLIFRVLWFFLLHFALALLLFGSGTVAGGFLLCLAFLLLGASIFLRLWWRLALGSLWLARFLLFFGHELESYVIDSVRLRAAEFRVAQDSETRLGLFLFRGTALVRCNMGFIRIFCIIISPFNSNVETFVICMYRETFCQLCFGF